MPRQPRNKPVDPLLRPFAAELLFHRTEADLSQNKLGELLGCTGQWIGAVERCESPPGEQFAHDLNTYFSTNGVFYRLWKEIKRAGRHTKLPPGFSRYAELEAQATSISVFSALLITGLLQPEDYARAVLRAGQKLDALEQLVATRMERQATVLGRDDPPGLWLLIDEAVIRRPVGGPAVMRQMLQRLKEVSAWHNVTVQVIPWMKAGAYPGLEGTFTILSFDDRPDVAYIEGAGGHGLLIEQPDEVAALAVRFRLIHAAALSDRESLEMITSAIAALEGE